MLDKGRKTEALEQRQGLCKKARKDVALFRQALQEDSFSDLALNGDGVTVFGVENTAIGRLSQVVLAESASEVSCHFVL